MKLRDPAPLLSDLAYERILEAVFERRVPMGGRLNQTALVELTGMTMVKLTRTGNPSAFEGFDHDYRWGLAAEAERDASGEGVE